MYRAAGGDSLTFSTEQEGKVALTKLFSARKCLLVLDDVWDTSSSRALDVISAESRLLVTTRKEDIVRGLGLNQDAVRIGELGSEQAIELLARYAAVSLEKLPPEAPAIASECGELPLALAMVGSTLRGRPFDRWKTALERLRTTGLSQLDVAVAALELSLAELTEQHRARYLDLAVFPEDALIPEATLQTYWAPEGLDAGEVQDIVDRFIDRSLARRDTEGRLFLHDLQHDYLRAHAGDLQALDLRLVAAYRQRAPEGLHTGPNDGYFFRAIVDHLFRAEGREAVHGLLFDVRWLAAKLASTETNALLADFDHLNGDAAAALLQSALRMSAHILDREPRALALQLLARLSPTEAPDLKEVVKGSQESIEPPALVPLRPSFTAAGGPLLRTFENHGHFVYSVALSADGRLALSVSGDDTLKLWDVGSGKLIRSFEVCGAYDSSVALSADGRLALSGSGDYTLKLWDVGSGMHLRSLKGHGAYISSVALSADGRLALSGSRDKTLKLWDVAAAGATTTSDSCLDSFAGDVAMTAVALDPSARWAVVGDALGRIHTFEVRT